MADPAPCLHPEQCRRKHAPRCAGCILTAFNRTPEGRAKTGEATRRIWDDPLKAVELKAAQALGRARPEVAVRYAETCRRNSTDPAVLAKISASNKLAWADPEKRANMMDGRAEGGRRRAGRGAVKAAGLPLYRRLVDRAITLRSQGLKRPAIIAALKADFGGGPPLA